MKNEDRETTATGNEDVAEQPKPKKPVLAKRIVREFVVRSGLRTGLGTGGGCEEDTDPGGTCYCTRSR